MMKATSSFVLTPFANLWTSRLQKPEVMLGGSQLELLTEMNSNTNLQQHQFTRDAVTETVTCSKIQMSPTHADAHQRCN